MRIFTLLTLFWVSISFLPAQKAIDFESVALEHLKEQADAFGLQSSDLREMNLVNAYKGSKSGVYHLYFNQQYNGTDIYNALTGVHLNQKGDVIYVADRLYDQLHNRISGFKASIPALDAVKIGAAYLGIQAPETAKMAALSNGIDQDIITFAPGNISKRPIPARLVYADNGLGELRLAWDLSIEMQGNVDWISMRVDAQTGALLDEVNWTVKCTFEGPHHHHSDCFVNSSTTKSNMAEAAMITDDGSAYNVFPFPFESPLDGNRSIISEPADTLASPFGWHDTDFAEGAEHTITRGNNTWSFPDRNGDLSPDFDVDGGAGLQFDFPFEQTLEPGDYTEAATVNLFYTINMMHDIAYYYGFDEAAGNFQQTNATGEGVGGDHVFGAAQFDGELGNNINNATFATPSDGGNGVMRMFEWNNSAADQEFLEVLAPSDVAGFYAAGTADYGEPVGEDPIIGEVVFAQDGIQFSTDACEPITNGAELEGKIVMVDRGGCDFSAKTYNAQENGAIAVIICNNQGNGIINMTGGDNASFVDIPTLFISREDCNELRLYAGNTLEIKLQEPEPVVGAERYDGSLDNGIIAHEFGHGISNRLTGGPGAAGCLGNDEQMGEGWSDFFTLALTTKPGQDGTEPRGIGNYVLREDESGRGIRNFPYTTDMVKNPQTYEDIILSGTAPHPLGEIWCAMLWDLHWRLVDEYGYDQNVKDGTGGNNIAIQLVMEGMALQNCSPGFIDGRDAILAADEVLYGGANQCLIWEVFARRGLGFSADQGDPNTRRDAKEAFDLPPFCQGDVVVTKEMTPVIDRGGIIEVNVVVNNFTTSVQGNTVITDLIPARCTYVNGSASIDPSSINNDKVIWDLGDLAAGEEINISYQLQATELNASTWIEQENFNGPDVESNWFAGSFEGNDIFELVPTAGPDTTAAWFVENTSAENDQYFFNINGHVIEGEQPVLRFTHQYLTNPGTDGGIVEISNDGGVTFNDAEGLIFRSPYRGKLAYTTFATVNQRAFWGDSEGWRTTYIDLSPYQGENILIRFRFGSIGGASSEGWAIDDFELFDAVYYSTDVSVSYGNNNVVSASPIERGTIVNPDMEVDAQQTIALLETSIYPNPASDVFYLKVPEKNSSAEYVIHDLHGRKVSTGNIPAGVEIQQIPIINIQTGMYIVQVIQEGKSYSTKLIIK